MNNNRRKLVNGEHNCPRQKAKHSRSHFTAGASRRRRLGCSQWAGRRDFTADIHLPPESHFITGSANKAGGGLQKLHFYSLTQSTTSFLLVDMRAALHATGDTLTHGFVHFRKGTLWLQAHVDTTTFMHSFAIKCWQCWGSIYNRATYLE